MFYYFRQNNSGGSFYGPAIIVYIQANSADEANELAEMHDLYFDGCNLGMDCNCCGDRWYRASAYGAVEDVDAAILDFINSQFYASVASYAMRDNTKTFAIYYLDGSSKFI